MSRIRSLRFPIVRYPNFMEEVLNGKPASKKEETLGGTSLKG